MGNREGEGGGWGIGIRGNFSINFHQIFFKVQNKRTLEFSTAKKVAVLQCSGLSAKAVSLRAVGELFRLFAKPKKLEISRRTFRRNRKTDETTPTHSDHPPPLLLRRNSEFTTGWASLSFFPNAASTAAATSAATTAATATTTSTA